MILDSIKEYYKDLHKNELIFKGYVPEEKEFLEKTSFIRSKLDYYKESLITYSGDFILGYIAGACDFLVSVGWHGFLVYGFLNLYLTTMYTMRYISTDSDSWKSNLSKKLSSFYDEPFVESFMSDYKPMLSGEQR